jgi:hypothetical protein
MPRLGMYDHLEAGDGLAIPVPMQDLAKRVCSLNYGQQRLLSAIVRERKANPHYKEYPQYREHTDRLEALLEDGFF